MKILVCDDDEVVLKTIEVALKNRAEVISVRDGYQALEFLKAHDDMDLIITDIHMPHYNGDDVLKLVREEMKMTTPIVMLSSDGEEEVIALALKSGVDDFIVKPVDARKLLDKITRFLK